MDEFENQQSTKKSMTKMIFKMFDDANSRFSITSMKRSEYFSLVKVLLALRISL